RVALPDATTLAHFMLVRTTSLVDGLVAHPERMKQNLERPRAPVLSEGVLPALDRKGPPRQKAYDQVHRNALAAHPGQRRVRDLVGKDPEISKVLSASELDEVFDLDHHLRHVDAIFARAFAEEPSA